MADAQRPILWFTLKLLTTRRQRTVWSVNNDIFETIERYTNIAQDQPPALSDPGEENDA